MRMTRSQGIQDLVQLSNQELAEIERLNRRNRDMADDSNTTENSDHVQDQEPTPPTNPLDMTALVQQLQLELAAMRREREPVRGRAIGDMDNPHYLNRSAIRLPGVDRNDYDIKPQLINLVKQCVFNGLPTQNPMDHIEDFEDICSTTRANGVSADYVKCKLFPYSLEGKASRWLKSLQPGSLTSWAEARAAFLDQFYTKSKTAALRNNISSFQQKPGEPLNEAWDRFKDYQRDCPHHGYTDEQLLNTFYNAIEWEFKNSLNAASSGDFMTNTRDEAFTLIENLAASSANHCPQYDRSKKVSSMEIQRIDDISKKLDMLIKNQSNMVGVNQVEGNREVAHMQDEQEDQREVDYVNYQNKGPNQNYLSYRSTNVENPQDLTFPAPTMPQGSPFQGKQFVQGTNQRWGNQRGFASNSGGGNWQRPYKPYVPPPIQQQQQLQQQQASSSGTTNEELKALIMHSTSEQQRTYKELNLKIDGVYGELSGKFESLSAHVKKLETQVAQTAEAIQRPQGALPGKVEKNPRETCNVVSHSIEDSEEEYKPPTPFPKELIKGEDPGEFTIPCQIGDLTFTDALCDSGASINVISYETMEKLGIDQMEDHTSTVSFGDASSKSPRGKLSDFNIIVGNCIIPTDFTVIEMAKPGAMPILLGRPFLKAVGARLDFVEQKVKLLNIDENVAYSIRVSTGDHCRMIKCFKKKEGNEPPDINHGIGCAACTMVKWCQKKNDALLDASKKISLTNKEICQKELTEKQAD